MPSARLYHVDKTDGKSYYLDVDPQTHSLIVTTNEHHHIHEGYAWSITGTATLNAGGVFRYLFVTVNSDYLVHLRYKVSGEAEGTFEIYEAPTYSNAGTSVTPVNRNRDNPTLARTTITHTPTTSNQGTQIYYSSFGAGRNSGTEAANEEWILARNKAYLIVITSDAAGNEMDWELFWYEHSKFEESYG